jgi:hypothetical protein
MFPSAICRLSVPLAASIFRASIAVGEPITVGAVDKIQAQVEATQAGQTRALGVKSEVYFRDRCHGREGARLQATLKRRHSANAWRKCDVAWHGLCPRAQRAYLPAKLDLPLNLPGTPSRHSLRGLADTTSGRDRVGSGRMLDCSAPFRTLRVRMDRRDTAAISKGGWLPPL